MKRIVCICFLALLVSYGMGNVNVPDSLILRKLLEPQPRETFWEKNIVLIISPCVSLLIGLISVVISIVVTNKNIKASKINLGEQLQTQKEILERQLQIQLATTVEKEWIQAIRKNISKMLNIAMRLRFEQNLRGAGNKSLIGVYIHQLKEIGGILQVYLNFAEKGYEYDLYFIADEFIRHLANDEYVPEQEYATLYENLISKFQILYKQKLLELSNKR